MNSNTSKTHTRNSSETRQRILNAARCCFSRKSYENVGMREIAGEAGVDAALVSRYFGNKEKVFLEVIQGAFHVEEHLPERMEDLGAFLIGQLLNDDGDDDDGFNPLRLLLLAAASPETAPIVSQRFHAEFVLPLAGKLTGGDAATRATLIASYVIGVATMRHLLASPELGPGSAGAAVALASAAIQACVGGQLRKG
jgi:AcrR family transcriptional regulator